jgi:hypothetical protein
MVEHDRRERSVALPRMRMPGREGLAEHDRAGGHRHGDRQEQERVRAEETLPQVPKARHGRSIGPERGNSGRFGYENGMSGGRIPRPREKSGDSGGRT